MKKQSGQTLVELIVCLLIGSILLSLALPSFQKLTLDSQKIQQVNQLLGMLHYARSTAVLEKRTISLCSGIAHCARSRNWNGSLLVFDDRNGNGQLDEQEELLRQTTLPEHYSWRWFSFGKRPHLTYEHDGTTRALNGTFTLCQTDKALHQIVISLSGRVRTQSPTASAKCD